MDLLFLEVDGSLANPYVAGAVAAWTVILSAGAVWLAQSIVRSGRAAAKTALFVGLLPLTMPAQIILGEILYQLTHPAVTSVGFWGGPPIWIAPAVSCSVALMSWMYFRWRHAGLPSRTLTPQSTSRDGTTLDSN